MILQPDHAGEPTTVGAAERLGRKQGQPSMSGARRQFNNARTHPPADGNPSGIGLLE
jgi:hypothetical protein